MKFKDIVAISGQPGLFRFLARSSNGVIVESLTDGRRMNATGSSKVSSLTEISLYTDNGELQLSKVFENMFQGCNGNETISHKSAPEDLKKYFGTVVPDYDRDMVHISDMKKIISWYNILVKAGMSDFTVEEQVSEKADGEKQDESAGAA